MRSTAPRARAGMLLAAALLPFSAFADALYLQLAEVGSEVEVSGLTASTVAERTRYGINEALKGATTEAILMDPQHEGSPDVTLSARVTRKGEKYRLTYVLSTTHAPVRTKSLAYDFVNPSLSDKGAVVMAQAVLAEARKLNVAAEEVPMASADTGEPPVAAGSDSLVSERMRDDAPRYDSRYEGMSGDSMGREQEPELPRRRRGRTTVDLGLALGFNSPSGIFGGELEYRVVPLLGLNLSAGAGAWGFRAGPGARLYPLGYSSFSPFLEAGMSFNMGGTSRTTISLGDESESFETQKLLTPVATVSVGMRQAMGPMYLGLRAGWGFRLREDNWRTSDGRDANILDALNVGTTQHGGFLCSATLGVTLF
jgi:hypothetical protein